MKWIGVLGRALRDGWLMLGTVCVLLIVVNGLLASLLDSPADVTVLPGTPVPDKWDAEFYRNTTWLEDYQREFRDARKVRWEPYAYWRRKPFSGQYINVDNRGHRRTWQPPELSDSAPAIWIFGGSTIWGSGARDDYAIPSALARALADAGAPAHVINFGERGWVRGQSLAYLQQLLLSGEKPAVVIFYDGANEVFADAVQDAGGAPQNEGNRKVEFRSATNIGQWFKAGFNQLEGFKKLIAQNNPGTTEPPELVAQAIVQRYEGQVAQLRALASVYGFEALVAWQPVIFSRVNPSDFEQMVINSSLVRHREAHLMASANVRSSSLVSHADFVDLSNVLDEVSGPVFMDFCHVSEAANEVVAQALAQRVLPHLKGGT